MKLIILFSSIFCGILFNTVAQVPNIEWQRSLGGSGSESANAIIETQDGGYVVAGYSYSNNGDVNVNHGGSDYWIIKLNAYGIITWQKSLGGSGNDEAKSIIQTQDGGYVIAGYTISNDGDVIGLHGASDYWIVKLDANGEIIWQKCLGGGDYDDAYSIKQTIDGGYIVAGSSKSTNGDISASQGYHDYWIVKLDTNASILWERSLGSSDWDVARSICHTQDGGYIIAGLVYSFGGDVSQNHGEWDYWIIKLDANGNLIWEKSLGGSHWDQCYSISQTQDGGYIVAGYSHSNDFDVANHVDVADYWIIKLDANGEIIWEKSLGGSNYEMAYSISQTQDGGHIIAGYTKSNDVDVTGNHGYHDYWIVKIDNIGEISWQKCLGGYDYEEAYSISQTQDGGYIIAGYSESNDNDVLGNHGSSDMWIVKLEGFPVSDLTLENKTFFTLYPNPASNNLSIEHNYAQNQTYSVLDVTGKLILQGFLSAKKDIIDLKNIAEGTYMLKVGNQVKQVVKLGN